MDEQEWQKRLPRDIGLQYPAAFCERPISREEALKAATAVCRQHHGLIETQWAQDDHEGRVLFCPIGKMYWRLTKQVDGMLKRLAWPKGM